MLPVVYTAGPFTAPTAWEIECNVMAMRNIALAVAKLSAVPLCPHANTSLFHGQCTPEFWYAATLELLRRCDAIVMHPLWQTSQGSRKEHDWATVHCMPIFYYTTEDGLSVSGLEEWSDKFMQQQQRINKTLRDFDETDAKSGPLDRKFSFRSAD